MAKTAPKPVGKVSIPVRGSTKRTKITRMKPAPKIRIKSSHR